MAAPKFLIVWALPQAAFVMRSCAAIRMLYAEKLWLTQRLLDFVIKPHRNAVYRSRLVTHVGPTVVLRDIGYSDFAANRALQVNCPTIFSTHILFLLAVSIGVNITRQDDIRRRTFELPIHSNPAKVGRNNYRRH